MVMRPPLGFAQSAKEGWNIGAQADAKKLRNFDSVVFCATGASAATAEILADLMKDSKYPVLICPDFKLPGFVGAKTLVIPVSYKGETEEVLATVQDAYRLGSRVLCVTSGGRLMRFAEQKGIDLILLPPGHSSKSAFPMIFFSLVAVLQKIGLIKNVSKEMPALVRVVQSDAWAERAKGIAEHIGGFTPLIYVSNSYRGVGMFWQYQLVATMKSPAHSADFPHLVHEDLFSLEGLKEGARVVLLRDEFEPGEIRKRISAAKKMLEERNIKLLELVLKGPSYITKVSSAAYLGMLVSHALATLSGTNPDEGTLWQQFQAHLRKEL